MSDIKPDDFEDRPSNVSDNEQINEPTYYIKWDEPGIKLWGEYLGSFTFEGKFGQSRAHKVRGGKGLKLEATSDEDGDNERKVRDLEDKVVAFPQVSTIKRIIRKEKRVKVGDPVKVEYLRREGQTKIVDAVSLEDREPEDDGQDELTPEPESDSESETMSKEEVEEKIMEITFDKVPFCTEANWKDAVKDETGLEVVEDNYKEIVKELKAL